MSREAELGKRAEFRQLCEDLTTTLDTKEKLVALWLVTTEILPEYTLTPEQEAFVERVNGLGERRKKRLISFMTRYLVGDTVRAPRRKKRAQKKKKQA